MTETKLENLRFEIEELKARLAYALFERDLAAKKRLEALSIFDCRLMGARFERYKYLAATLETDLAELKIEIAQAQEAAWLAGI